MDTTKTNLQIPTAWGVTFDNFKTWISWSLAEVNELLQTVHEVNLMQIFDGIMASTNYGQFKNVVEVAQVTWRDAVVWQAGIYSSKHKSADCQEKFSDPCVVIFSTPAEGNTFHAILQPAMLFFTRPCQSSVNQCEVW